MWFIVWLGHNSRNNCSACLVRSETSSNYYEIILNVFIGIQKSQGIPDIKLEEASTLDPCVAGNVCVRITHNISSPEVLLLRSPDSRCGNELIWLDICYHRYFRPASPTAYSTTSSKTVSEESLENDGES